MGISGLGLSETFKRLIADPPRSVVPDDRGQMDLRMGLGADLRLARQNLRNGWEGIRYLQAAQDVLNEVAGLLARATELLEQLETGASCGNTGSEFQRIVAAISHIGQSAEFNGAKLFISRTLEVQVGGFPSVDLTLEPLDGVFEIETSIDTVMTSDGARAAHRVIQEAIEKVGHAWTSLDASKHRLTSMFSILGTQVENVSAAYSWARDARIVEEVVNLIKFELLSQVGINALSQAQPTSGEVVAILRHFRVETSNSLPGVIPGAGA